MTNQQATVKAFQRVELEGKTYDVTHWSSGVSSVKVLTKRGVLALYGHKHRAIVARVLEAAKRDGA